MSDLDDNWLVLQLTDSAFPAGALAHSGGLEAAHQLGEIASAEDLIAFLLAALKQASTSTAPLVAMACRSPDRLLELDRFCDAMLTNAVANTASRAQGRAVLAAATRVFESAKLSAWQSALRDQDGPCHLAIAIGAVYASMSIPPERAASGFLFVTLRAMISAAVRLGIVGPIEGQAIQFQLSRHAPAWARAAMAIENLDQIHSSAPLLDFYQALHAQLYSRLFVS